MDEDDSLGGVVDRETEPVLRSSVPGHHHHHADEVEDVEAIFDVMATISGSLRPEQGHRHTRYAIDVVVPGSSRAWIIHRKYYEFKRLHNALWAISFPGPRLPPRQLWGPRTKTMLERRAESLDMWLQGTLAVWKSFYSPGEDDASLTVTTLLTVFLCRDSEFYVSNALAAPAGNAPSGAPAGAAPTSLVETNGGEEYALDASVHSRPSRRTSDDATNAETALGGMGGQASSTSSSAGGLEGTAVPSSGKFKRVMRKMSRTLRSLFAISVNDPRSDLYAYGREDSSHHHRSTQQQQQQQRPVDVRSTSAPPTAVPSNSGTSRSGTATGLGISWLMRGRMMFKDRRGKKKPSTAAPGRQRKFARDLEEDDVGITERRKLQAKLASEVRSSTVLGGGVLMMKGVAGSKASKRKLEVPTADEEGSIHRVFAVVDREEDEEEEAASHHASDDATDTNVTQSLVQEVSCIEAQEVYKADKKTEGLAEEEREKEAPQANPTGGTSVMRRVISMTDDDGSELEWVFDSEQEDANASDHEPQAILHANNQRHDASSSKRRMHKRRHRRSSGKASSRRGDPLFLGRVLQYVPAPSDNDDLSKTQARRDLERMFLICEVEVLPEGGHDLLRHGYGMVSVPPSPRSREVYKRPWRAYTEKVLQLVERRLQAAAGVSGRARANSGDGDWIDSGSEEGGSEAEQDIAASEFNFVQRTRWLQSSFAHSRQHDDQDSEHGFQQQETEGDDEFYEEDEVYAGEDGYDSEGWASEAANDSYEGGNDREVFGSWEEGTIWIGPKRAPSANRLDASSDRVPSVEDSSLSSSGAEEEGTPESGIDSEDEEESDLSSSSDEAEVESDEGESDYSSSSVGEVDNERIRQSLGRDEIFRFEQEDDDRETASDEDDPREIISARRLDGGNDGAEKDSSSSLSSPISAITSPVSEHVAPLGAEEAIAAS